MLFNTKLEIDKKNDLRNIVLIAKALEELQMEHLQSIFLAHTDNKLICSRDMKRELYRDLREALKQIANFVIEIERRI
jgi:hypothetical protein